MFTIDSGCSLIHPDPNEADTSPFISSLETGILFRDLFTISDCNFINSGGLGILPFPPHERFFLSYLVEISPWPDTDLEHSWECL